MLNAFGQMLTGRTERGESPERPGATSEVPEKLVQEFFNAIQNQDTDKVRQLLVVHKTDLTRATFKPDPQSVRFPAEVERDAYTLLGAYLGPLTGLQFSILTGCDGVAKDILDSTFEQDVDATFGNGNTALHLAVLLGASLMVSALIERGADINLKNKRGYSVVDMSDNPDILKLLQSGTAQDDE
ncbi:hypothetical protein BGZ70_009305 [Mortierella alpina]|uniref:Ankyrin repeat domain-containing protein n=1 Tax=Mortierella alpina TaxID=64518 RepID=A0A9P6J216_MORAP|nr:hypothetical protein BGZ70_009305 [Mortierella alpina]